jgi:hypothetical protein
MMVSLLAARTSEIVMARWYWKNGDLNTHHRRHPGNPDERDCWCGLVGIGGREVKVHEYRQESLLVFQTSDFEYLSEYRRGEWSKWEPRFTAVDSRDLLVTAELSGRIRTCFHIHKQRVRCRGPRHEPRGQRKQELERRLQRRKQAGRECSICWEKK